jgi:hypothetical protein
VATALTEFVKFGTAQGQGSLKVTPEQKAAIVILIIQSSTMLIQPNQGYVVFQWTHQEPQIQQQEQKHHQ